MDFRFFSGFQDQNCRILEKVETVLILETWEKEKSQMSVHRSLLGFKVTCSITS